MSASKKTFRIGDWDVSRLEPNTFYRIYKDERLGNDNYGEIILLRDADRKGVCYKATTRLIKYLNNQDTNCLNNSIYFYIILMNDFIIKNKVILKL